MRWERGAQCGLWDRGSGNAGGEEGTPQPGCHLQCGPCPHLWVTGGRWTGATSRAVKRLPRPQVQFLTCMKSALLANRAGAVRTQLLSGSQWPQTSGPQTAEQAALPAVGVHQPWSRGWVQRWGESALTLLTVAHWAVRGSEVSIC